MLIKASSQQLKIRRGVPNGYKSLSSESVGSIPVLPPLIPWGSDAPSIPLSSRGVVMVVWPSVVQDPCSSISCPSDYAEGGEDINASIRGWGRDGDGTAP